MQTDQLLKMKKITTEVQSDNNPGIGFDNAVEQWLLSYTLAWFKYHKVRPGRNRLKSYLRAPRSKSRKVKL